MLCLASKIRKIIADVYRICQAFLCFYNWSLHQKISANGINIYFLAQISGGILSLSNTEVIFFAFIAEGIDIRVPKAGINA
jgi:hypothetical protein